MLFNITHLLKFVLFALRFMKFSKRFSSYFPIYQRNRQFQGGSKSKDPVAKCRSRSVTAGTEYTTIWLRSCYYDRLNNTGLIYTFHSRSAISADGNTISIGIFIAL